MRLDKYLKIASYQVKVGDVIEVTIGTRTIKVKVLDVPEYATKQGAALLYSEITE